TRAPDFAVMSGAVEVAMRLDETLYPPTRSDPSLDASAALGAKVSEPASTAPASKRRSGRAVRAQKRRVSLRLSSKRICMRFLSLRGVRARNGRLLQYDRCALRAECPQSSTGHAASGPPRWVWSRYDVRSALL